MHYKILEKRIKNPKIVRELVVKREEPPVRLQRLRFWTNIPGDQQ